MPFIKLSPETKLALAELATLPFVQDDNERGETFVDSEVYELLKIKMKQFNLWTFDETIRKILADNKGNLS